MHRSISQKIWISFLVLSTGITACSSPDAAPAAEKVPATAESTATPAEPTPTPEPIACTIAFESLRDGNSEIYVMQPDGSGQTNVTNNPGYDRHATWSPDGKQIAFVSDRSGAQQIYVINADGSVVRELSEGNEFSDADLPDWSDDGQFISYQDGGDIFLIRADGSAPAVNLTNSPAKDINPSFSPDSRRIAWVADGNISTMNLKGEDIRQLTSDGKVPNVAWTVDGRLFTSGWEHPQMGNGKYVMNTDGSDIVPAGGKGELFRLFPFWTADGDAVECVSLDLDKGIGDVYLVSPLYEETFINLSNNPAEDRDPVWPAGCLSGRELPAEATPEPSATPTTEVKTFSMLYLGDTPEDDPHRIDFEKACASLKLDCKADSLQKLKDWADTGITAMLVATTMENAESLRADLKYAVSRGVTVFLAGAEIDLEGVYSISSQPEEWERTTMRWLAQKAGNVGEMILYLSDPDTQKELAGEVMDEFKNVNFVEVVQGKIEHVEDIKPMVGEWIAKYPNLKAIWAGADMAEFLMGVEDNTQGQEAWIYTNCEASKAGLCIWNDSLDKFPQMDCVTVSRHAEEGYYAAAAAYLLFNGDWWEPGSLGGRFGRTMFAELPVITKENMREVLERIRYANEDARLLVYPPLEVIRDRYFTP